MSCKEIEFQYSAGPAFQPINGLTEFNSRSALLQQKSFETNSRMGPVLLAEECHWATLSAWMTTFLFHG